MRFSAGRLSIRHPVATILVWLVVVIASLAGGIGVFGRLDVSVGRVPGSESDRADELITRMAPKPVTLTAVLSARPAAGPIDREEVGATVTDLRVTPGVTGVTGPRPGLGGETLLILIHLEPGDEMRRTADAVAGRMHGVRSATVAVAGGPLTNHEFSVQAQSDTQRAEMLTTPVVLLFLLLIFGGLIAAGLPLIVAFAGVGGTFGLLSAYSLVGGVSVYAIQVATMLSVGLAIDYGLLTVTRFREERAIDPEVPAAVARTVATAGRTVIFSGLTVAAVLAGLTVFPDPFLRSMGLAGVGVVLVVASAATTLLPALLTLFGHRIGPARPPARRGIFARIARAVQRRPVPTALVAALVMAVIALPVFGLRLAQLDPRLLPEGSQSREVHDVIVRDFPDLNRPAPVVVAAVAPTDSPELAGVRRRMAALPHVTDVQTVGSGALTVFSADLDVPASSEAARGVVKAIRAMPASPRLLVTGDTAQLVDYQAAIISRLPWAVGVIALATLVLLFMFTRSVLLPVKAVATNLLSIGAALGGVVWVFQQGHLAGWFGTSGLGAVHLSVPVLVGATAFGLSVDYEVFLLSRIREHWLTTGDNERAVAIGLQTTGRVITSAALLMGVVFAGFLTAGFVPVKAIGLGLLLAVVLDATVVRLFLVPATMTLVGRYNWWAPPAARRLR
ncbi:MMPL family transporter [Paractinoplanes brasiliensis]|uniref:RND superfamily putative drug exporter n=1 Tax=Paractinoplanes brasiliensis TaxID=52695 RepID=A0A4R6K3L2_9ACTN|nr:MMPL family transporter [Actinoplanes brasiliensis]TDO42286.1 RND superfamily putative drug exporter [Actinoplanes brasiliensis]GID29512.1 putative membrane protein [Actinoplanes brasiliensis]